MGPKELYFYLTHSRVTPKQMVRKLTSEDHEMRWCCPAHTWTSIKQPGLHRYTSPWNMSLHPTQGHGLQWYTWCGSHTSVLHVYILPKDPAQSHPVDHKLPQNHIYKHSLGPAHPVCTHTHHMLTHTAQTLSGIYFASGNPSRTKGAVLC